MRHLVFVTCLFFSIQFASFAQTHVEVEAKEGDGIYTLLRNHGLDPSLFFRLFLELNKDRLDNNNHLYAGKSYIIPLADSVKSEVVKPEEASDEKIPERHEDVAVPETTPIKGVLKVPFFGKKFEDLKITDNQLEGAVFYLSSGHGGPDPGAIGKYGSFLLSEDEYAYDVTLRLARRLMEHGATVYMITRDENDGIRDENILQSDVDEVCYPDLPIPLNQKQRLRQRTQAVNRLYIKHKGSYQRMLAIHVDSRSKSQNIDVFFYYHENSPLGKKLAQSIHKTFASKYSRHQPNRDYSGTISTRSSLYVLKYSHPPAIFVELGNIMNDRDQRRFIMPDNRQALANWLFEGALADYKNR